ESRRDEKSGWIDDRRQGDGLDGGGFNAGRCGGNVGSGRAGDEHPDSASGRIRKHERPGDGGAGADDTGSEIQSGGFVADKRDAEPSRTDGERNSGFSAASKRERVAAGDEGHAAAGEPAGDESAD